MRKEPVSFGWGASWDSADSNRAPADTVQWSSSKDIQLTDGHTLLLSQPFNLLPTFASSLGVLTVRGMKWPLVLLPEL